MIESFLLMLNSPKARGKNMEEKKSCEIECNEMLDFMMELQEDALRKSDKLSSKKSDLESQREKLKFELQEQKNIDSEDVFRRKELEESLTSQIEEIEIERKKQQTLYQCLGRLRNMFFSMNEKLQEINDTEIELMDFGTKILETQEMDRNRISRDLHDSSVQGLTILVHKMEYCIRMIEKDPIRVKLELQTMIELNKEIINGMREIIYDLRPMALNNIGLASTIDAYCLNIGRCTNVDIIFQVDGVERGISSIMSVTLYRIVQEAIGNILQHASAKKATVVLTYLENSIELTVEDDGKGFDMTKVKRAKDNSLHGFGLSTMKERTKLLKGTFFIDSVLGKGTRMHISVPAKYVGGSKNETNKNSNSR